MDFVACSLAIAKEWNQNFVVYRDRMQAAEMSSLVILSLQR